MKKKIILILTFLLPAIGVFIFKFFSESHFEVKIFYQDDVPADQDCSGISAPYAVDPQVTFGNSSFRPFLAEHFKVIAFEDTTRSLTIDLNRIGDAFYGIERVDIYLLFDSLRKKEDKIPKGENIRSIPSSAHLLNELKQCVFLFEELEDDAVLVDDKNRIRGFYNLDMSEEVDSLIIETKILLREKELTK